MQLPAQWGESHFELAFLMFSIVFVLIKEDFFVVYSISIFVVSSEVQHHTLARTNLLCMKNAGTQWTMVSYLKNNNN